MCLCDRLLDVKFLCLVHRICLACAVRMVSVQCPMCRCTLGLVTDSLTKAMAILDNKRDAAGLSGAHARGFALEPLAPTAT